MKGRRQEQGAFSLTDRILLHLSSFKFREDDAEVSHAFTQDGIALALGATRAHVTVSLSRLGQKGFVEERLCRVKSSARRRKAYFLTTTGRERAKNARQHLEASVVALGKGASAMLAHRKLDPVVLAAHIRKERPTGLALIARESRSLAAGRASLVGPHPLSRFLDEALRTETRGMPKGDTVRGPPKAERDWTLAWDERVAESQEQGYGSEGLVVDAATYRHTEIGRGRITLLIGTCLLAAAFSGLSCNPGRVLLSVLIPAVLLPGLIVGCILVLLGALFARSSGFLTGRLVLVCNLTLGLGATAPLLLLAGVAIDPIEVVEFLVLSGMTAALLLRGGDALRRLRETAGAAIGVVLCSVGFLALCGLSAVVSRGTGAYGIIAGLFYLAAFLADRDAPRILVSTSLALGAGASGIIVLLGLWSRLQADWARALWGCWLATFILIMLPTLLAETRASRLLDGFVHHIPLLIPAILGPLALKFVIILRPLESMLELVLALAGLSMWLSIAKNDGRSSVALSWWLAYLEAVTVLAFLFFL